MHPYYEDLKTSERYYLRIFEEDNLSFPLHLHNHTEFVYVVEGSTQISINEKVENLQQGDMAVIFPNDIHSYYSESYSKCRIFIFSPEIISGYFGKRVNKTLENPFFSKSMLCDSTIHLINLLFEESTNTNNKYVIKGLLYSIFGKLTNSFVFKSNEHIYNNTIQSLLSYIGNHFNENITLDILAKHLGFSKFYISRLFKHKIGYTLNDYVNSLRINRAEDLLRETDLTMVNIALECGFESCRNFNRVFKGFNGNTPSEYRNMLL
jgi:AraC-like DNA-binding protein